MVEITDKVPLSKRLKRQPAHLRGGYGSRGGSPSRFSTACRKAVCASALKTSDASPPFSSPWQLRPLWESFEGVLWRRDGDSNLRAVACSLGSESPQSARNCAYGSRGGSLPGRRNFKRSLLGRVFVTGATGFPTLLIPLQPRPLWEYFEGGRCWRPQGDSNPRRRRERPVS